MNININDTYGKKEIKLYIFINNNTKQVFKDLIFNIDK